jgi:hypothetical protein
MMGTKPGLVLLSIVLLAGIAQGCASLIQGSTQQIPVTSTPPGATIVVNGFQRLQTPAVLELSRKESHQLEFTLDGYHPEMILIRQVTSNMIAGNIIAGGLIGFAVDHSTGAAFRLVPEIVDISLRPITPDPKILPPPSPPAEEILTTHPAAEVLPVSP